MAPQGKPPVKIYKVSTTTDGKTYITVDVQPWAEVLLDGKTVGHTPLQKVISAGRHTIHLRNPQVGYEKKFKLKFKKGTKSKLMDAAGQ